MRFAQKLIKILALGLACCIILTMFAVVIGGVSLVGEIFGVNMGLSGSEQLSTAWQAENTKVEKLVVHTGAMNLKITESAEVKQIQVDTNNSKIKTELSGDTLKIIEENRLVWFGGNRNDLEIKIPQGYNFAEVNIETGAGAMEIEHLETNGLRLELGAGRTSINRLVVSGSARIDGGAGLVEIKDGTLHNLDLEIGAGRADITAHLTGNCSAESGVGQLKLSLTGAEKDYRFMVKKGLGLVTINHRTQEDGATYGDGENQIKVESGISAVEIETLAR